ncbi:TetR/AcrR family transcriptional regulator [Shimazuella sp. AN120528]|uniref:TetR/AcrR family transcriptional regulator n=1 Tax=Shimazuella soli TaxID=1892854 RepID=UPI001F0E0867|nr:TetR/AcrR family transcriptional regulator [Shimazuella soli]MCH5584489.1 TetR/AcrR family transcriptional regulator [Shimazuella soli]
MRQEERRSQTKKLLLDTVISLIQSKGCEAVTMADIVNNSGLSKGAIFHYIKSKDELFAWVLQDRLEQVNEGFMQQVVKNPNFEQPMKQIADSLWELEDKNDITNQVWMYLLSKAEQPMVGEVLTRFYAQSFSYSKIWIEQGQIHGVIPKELDAIKTAEIFVLISYGIRLRSAIPGVEASFGVSDFISIINQQLGKKK